MDLPSPQTASRWRDRILAALESVLEPWFAPPAVTDETIISGTRHFRLVKHAEQFFAQQDIEQKLTVNELASALGVPRRTLFHAFRQWLGIGPYAYLQLIRLHELRDALLAAKPEETTVTALVSASGFNHMGSLSMVYKKHFGEAPSDTLKRDSESIHMNASSMFPRPN